MTRYEKLQYERLNNKKQLSDKEQVSTLREPGIFGLLTLIYLFLVCLMYIIVLNVYYINITTPKLVPMPEVKNSVQLTISVKPTIAIPQPTQPNIVINLDKRNWSPEQTKNILIVEDAAKFVNHPNPKRMGAHLITESSGNIVLDGDITNGPFKKSYGINQVKLGTVYYVKNKRPDLIKLYAPEVNSLPQEDILDKLRKDAFFNSKIAAMMHIVLIDVCGDADKASIAYNRGVCNPDAQGMDYLNKIKLHERLL